jgi:flavin reductase (DIM6/NTAB) family NADH-FMN oxidoreductase RutF
VLSAGQHEASLRFAERREGKFDGIPYRVGRNGTPILEGSLANLECEVEAEYPGGDHVILVARVTAAGSTEGLPLVFFRGGYTTVAQPVTGEEPE